MNLPERITLQTKVYGDGAKGLAFQIARNEEHGVQCDARREKRGAPWIETWTSDFLPDREFGTYRELHAALAAAPETPREAVTVIGVEPRSKGSLGHCWLCRGEWIHTVRAKKGWRPADGAHIPCCDACLEKVKADPAAAIEAREKWVREHPIML